MPIHVYTCDGVVVRAYTDSLETPPARATIDQLVELSTKVVVIESDKETYTLSNCAPQPGSDGKTKGLTSTLAA
jgi:hypothetical protein